MGFRQTRNLIVSIALGVAMVLGSGAAAFAQESGEERAGSGRAPLPRFMVLRADEVNVRSGPGPRFPIEWVFKRRDLPVEVIAEFDTWRRIRDPEGTEGWVHQSLLTGGRRRTVIITGQVRALRRGPSETEPVVARVEPGVVARLLRCRDLWCEAEMEELRGWLRRTDVWGVYPTEKIE